MSACKKTSKSARAGVIWPVGRIHTMLKEKTPLRASPRGAAYLAGVMDFLTKDLAKCATSAMPETGKKTLGPREIQLGLCDSWAGLMADGTIAGGGVLPNLIPSKKSSKKSVKAAEPTNC